MTQVVPNNEIAFLCDRERMLRSKVQEKPDDITARLDLAACLLLQAAYRAGQESICQEQKNSQSVDGGAIPEPSSGPDGRDVSSLLRECLQHLQSARDVTPDPVPWIQANLLFMLVQWFCQAEGLQQFHEEANRLLTELTDAIIQRTE
jgi:hypothetical protein